MKKCFKFGRVKPVDRFYRHPRMADGRLGKCTSCTKKDVRARYQKTRITRAEYERRRFQDPLRKLAALKYQRKRRAKSPGKYRAAYAVTNAIRDGRLMRSLCEKCGDKAQAHHDDYRRPLVVRWLCRKHHLERHGKVAYV